MPKYVYEIFMNAAERDKKGGAHVYLSRPIDHSGSDLNHQLYFGEAMRAVSEASLMTTDEAKNAVALVWVTNEDGSGTTILYPPVTGQRSQYS